MRGPLSSTVTTTRFSRRSGSSGACAIAALLLLAAPAVTRADPAPAPFGHACTAQNGVRFCPTTTLAGRVSSFDGTPLDADVTLPPSGTGPFPTIVFLNWLGGDKTNNESSSPTGDGNNSYDYNNVYYAQRGYAVLTYSARGNGNSCGQSSSRTSPGCDRGWTHFGDQRYEERDTQYLLGLLVDEGIANPYALGVTGESYGAGEALELAYLKNQARLTDGSFAPWLSPNGTPLAIGAVFARWPWSSLVAGLMPNGRFTDTRVPGPTDSFNPLGVEYQSGFAGSVSYLSATTFLAPSGQDPTGDFASWYQTLNAGEPFGPAAVAAAAEMDGYHSAVGLMGQGRQAAPMLIQTGFTDNEFPMDQGLRVYNEQRSINPSAPVVLQLGDIGHPPGGNKPGEDRAYFDQASAFFDAWLTGSGSPPAAGGATAYTLTCWSGAPAAGPWTAPSYGPLATGSISFGSAVTQTVSSAGGNQQIATALDQNGAWTNQCNTVPAEVDPGTAVYTFTSPGLTMMGAPTINATVDATGQYAQLGARLWDVLPNGQQRLISRGVYRLLPSQSGPVTFQLHADAYTFGDGDTIKLEVLGRDSPVYQADSASFNVAVSNLTVSLPTTGSWGTLVSEATGSCVDAAGWGTSSGTKVQQWQCGNRQSNQQWQLQPAGGGYSELLNRHAAGYGEVVDVTGGSTATANGTPIQLWAYAGGANQQWQLAALGNGYYHVIARHSGKCLDVPGGSTANGVQLQQWDCNANPQQAFRFNPQP